MMLVVKIIVNMLSKLNASYLVRVNLSRAKISLIAIIKLALY
jgi:hypothetical protein